MSNVEIAAKAKKQPGREGKVQVAAFIPQDDAFVIQELLLRLSRERGSKVTMQEAIGEGLKAFCEKNGVKLEF